MFWCFLCMIKKSFVLLCLYITCQLLLLKLQLLWITIQKSEYMQRLSKFITSAMSTVWCMSVMRVMKPNIIISAFRSQKASVVMHPLSNLLSLESRQNVVFNKTRNMLCLWNYSTKEGSNRVTGFARKNTVYFVL